MKKTLLTIAILAATLITANAQMQGNLYVGGRLGYSTNTITAKYSYEGITLSGIRCRDAVRMGLQSDDTLENLQGFDPTECRR